LSGGRPSPAPARPVALAGALSGQAGDLESLLILLGVLVTYPSRPLLAIATTKPDLPRSA